jgi:hypothetical protein
MFEFEITSLSFAVERRAWALWIGGSAAPPARRSSLAGKDDGGPMPCPWAAWPASGSVALLRVVWLLRQGRKGEEASEHLASVGGRLLGRAVIAGEQCDVVLEELGQFL